MRYYDFPSWMYRPYLRIRDLYYDTKNGLTAVFQFRKVVWRQVNWDYEGIYHLLYVKVSGLRKSLETGHGYAKKSVAYQIKNEPDFWTKDLGEPETDWEKENAEYSKENIKRQVKTASAARICERLLWRLTTDWYSDLPEEAGKIWEPSYRMRDRDHDLLFKLMSEYMKGWWT